VEKLSDIDNLPPTDSPNYAKVNYHISRRVEVTSDLISKLKSENRTDLLTAINEGKEVFTTVEFQGIKDLFELCDLYYTSIEKFVEYGVSMKFIT
jgi:hypothetical protein